MTENWEIRWKDYYKILQLDPSAEPEVIKAAYDRLAHKYHPDVNKNPIAGLRMSDINEAFDVLRDPLRRRQYHAIWLQKTNQQVKGRKRLNLGWLILPVLIIAVVVFILIVMKKPEPVVPVDNTETTTSVLPLNLKLKSITLPTISKISAGDLCYEQSWIVTNLEPSDVRVRWEASSSLTGIFDSGYVSIPAKDSREVKRSYSYTIDGTEIVTYKLYYADVVLDSLSATHVIGK